MCPLVAEAVAQLLGDDRDKRVWLRDAKGNYFAVRQPERLGELAGRGPIAFVAVILPNITGGPPRDNQKHQNGPKQPFSAETLFCRIFSGSKEPRVFGLIPGAPSKTVSPAWPFRSDV